MAGARFCKLRRQLKSREVVKIVKSKFEGETCYQIVTSKNERIGYVPRRLVSFLDNSTIVESYIASLNPHAVPWKQYQVTVAHLPLRISSKSAS